MAEATLVGKAQTVLGPVDPGVLGITSAHEHILSDMSAYFQEPEKPSEKHLADRASVARDHRLVQGAPLQQP